jgi:hypothetical protein
VRPSLKLDAATSADEVEILWPDGVQRKNLRYAIDRIVTVVEGN